MSPKKPTLPPFWREFFAKMGSQGGRKSAANLTKAERVARAKKAVAAREAKRGKKP